jgi:hypothetical protein
MSDEQFDDFLQRNARDYNAPPAVTPRDAMWENIAAARAAKRVAAPAAPAAPDIAPIGVQRPTRRLAPWIGMAATLLIGVGIGRVVFTERSTVTQVASAPNTPTTEDAEPVTPNDGPVGTSQTPAAAPEQIVLPAASRARTRLPAATRAEPNFTPMTVASRDHLQRAEALVSIVAATPADAGMDSLTGKWAREMLTNTRLLLDSPAGEDPVRRRLLEDLETVLVQLVQRSGASTEEREILDRTLQRTQLLTRLRTGAAGI